MCSVSKPSPLVLLVQALSECTEHVMLNRVQKTKLRVTAHFYSGGHISFISK